MRGNPVRVQRTPSSNGQLPLSRLPARERHRLLRYGNRPGKLRSPTPWRVQRASVCRRKRKHCDTRILWHMWYSAVCAKLSPRSIDSCQSREPWRSELVQSRSRRMGGERATVGPYEPGGSKIRQESSAPLQCLTWHSTGTPVRGGNLARLCGGAPVNLIVRSHEGHA